MYQRPLGNRPGFGGPGERLPARGRVRIVVAFEPWQLVLTSRAVGLHGEIFSVLLEPKHVSDELLDEDVNALFTVGDNFILQWESDSVEGSGDETLWNAPAGALTADGALQRKEWRKDGVELFFRLASKDLELWRDSLAPKPQDDGALSRSFRLFGKERSEARPTLPSMWDL